MTHYIIRRLFIAIPTLILISIISFTIIQLPPGDYLDQRITELQRQGDTTGLAQVQSLRIRYGLDLPFWKQYLRWAGGFLHGDYGESFRYNREVKDLIWERLSYTLVLSVTSLIFVYALAIPMGIYSATHKYKWTDNLLTLCAFLGMSLPGFLVALVVLVIAFKSFGTPLFGLFSPYYQMAGWSWGKVVDLLQHLWIPTVVIALNGTAGLMRVMRGNLLDVLGEPYVRTARAKGLTEHAVVHTHAVRIAINPLISILGMSLPDILSGTMIISIVLGLPTVGPLLLQALKDQDMYLAGTLLMFMSILLIIGNLLADIVLAWVDPRIRYE